MCTVNQDQLVTVKMCHFVCVLCVVCVLYIAVTLSSALCLVLLAGAVCVCVVLSFDFIFCPLYCQDVVFRQYNCQDVSSFNRDCVCVLYILLTFFCPLYCQDVSSFGNTTVKMRCLSAGAVCVCCTFFCLYFLPTVLSRCVVFQQGCVCLCVCCTFFDFILQNGSHE